MHRCAVKLKVKSGTLLFINVAVSLPIAGATAGNGFRQALQNAKVDKSRISTVTLIATPTKTTIRFY
jgi:hypothetical protein